MEIKTETIVYIIKIIGIGALTGYLWICIEEILEELLKHKLTFNNKVLVYVISWVLVNGFIGL